MSISVESGFIFFASVTVSFFVGIITNMLVSIHYTCRERSHHLDSTRLCPDQKISAERRFLIDLKSDRSIIFPTFGINF